MPKMYKVHPDVWPPQYYFWMTSHIKTYESFHKIWFKCGSWNLKHTIHHFTMFYLVSTTTIFIKLSAYTRTTFLLEQHGGFCNLWTSDGTRSVQRCSYVQSLNSIKCILHNMVLLVQFTLFLICSFSKIKVLIMKSYIIWVNETSFPYERQLWVTLEINKFSRQAGAYKGNEIACERFELKWRWQY